MYEDRSQTSVHRAAGKSLGEMLVEEGFITAGQLEDALELQRRQGGNLAELLTGYGFVKAEDLAAVLSVLLDVPLIDMKRHTVEPDALRLIPEEMARKYTVVPLDVISHSLIVVMADPEDIRAIEDIRAHVRMRVEVAMGIPAEIKQAIDLNYRSGSEIERQVSQFAAVSTADDAAAAKLTARTPIAQTLDLLITQAVRDRASDFHIEPQEDKLRLRYRIDGILHDMLSLPLSAESPLVSRIKILADMNIAEQRRAQDGQFSMQAGDRIVDIRAATMQTVWGERVTLRILDKSLSLFTLAGLGLLPDALRKYQTVIKSPFGMVLVGGPTGSGKTTTLYASINELDRSERNIMTVEDPVEYHFRDISQTQVNVQAGITFAGGLRAIVRHDPDVILVGEIRDKDTTTMAIQAALTGHLVLSSIHANDAVGVLFRLLDLGIEPYLVSSTLIAVVAQRMVRRICTHCRAPAQPSPEEQIAYEEEMKEHATFYHGSGCNLCANTGYRGRIGIFEILLMSEEVRRMLCSNASAGDIKRQALSEGMASMKRDGMLKVKAGITSVSEVMSNVFSIG